ncbi:MAG: SDR family NAD(P)-dependent oxidoreductase [Pseudonocardia sp.]
MNWCDRHVLVTGGASFIGSHLVEELVTRGARVRIVDNLSSGRITNLGELVSSGAVEFVEADLLDSHVTDAAVAGIEVVFHNAADHGGRGYIDRHQVDCATNLALDGMVFRAADRAGVSKVVFASSGCVYPGHLQDDPDEVRYLTEDLVTAPYAADNMYGWAKLMGELTLRAYAEEGRMRTASARYFTAYGPRCPESHAVMAMIARGMTGQNPFVIWGTGRQVRNWTHVDDIVEGTIRAAERIDDGTAVNIGTTERVSVLECATEVLTYLNRDAEFTFDTSMPTGPYNRVCDQTRCVELLGWTPRTDFKSGLRSTIDWYLSTHDAADIAASLERRLTERRHD